MTTLTVRQVLEALQRIDPSQLDQPMKVWLPGSTISLTDNGDRNVFWNAKHGAYLVEGNLDPGSALAG